MGHIRLSVVIKSTEILLASVIFLLSYGCAPTMIQAGKEELARLKNEPEILAVHYTPPTFMAEGPIVGSLGTLFGLVGAAIELAAAKSAGDQIVRDYSIEDPALRVKDKFLSAIAAGSGFKNIRSIKEALPTDDLIELKEKFGKIIMIDFLTWEWAVLSFNPFFRHDQLAYIVRSRLVLLEDSKILWQGVCRFNEPVPPLGELKINNAALLKEKLKQAAATCAEELVTQFSGKEKP